MFTVATSSVTVSRGSFLKEISAVVRATRATGDIRPLRKSRPNTVRQNSRARRGCSLLCSGASVWDSAQEDPASNFFCVFCFVSNHIPVPTTVRPAKPGFTRVDFRFGAEQTADYVGDSMNLIRVGLVASPGSGIALQGISCFPKLACETRQIGLGTV